MGGRKKRESGKERESARDEKERERFQRMRERERGRFKIKESMLGNKQVKLVLL